MTRTLNDENIAALEKDKQLLDEVLEIGKRDGITREDQDRIDSLIAERVELHKTAAWRETQAEKQDW
jgi:hypothetical protein